MLSSNSSICYSFATAKHPNEYIWNTVLGLKWRIYCNNSQAILTLKNNIFSFWHDCKIMPAYSWLHLKIYLKIMNIFTMTIFTISFIMIIFVEIYIKLTSVTIFCSLLWNSITHLIFSLIWLLSCILSHIDLACSAICRCKQTKITFYLPETRKFETS